MTDPDPEEQWSWIAAELKSYRDAQRQAWGDLDDVTMARYLAGEATEEERSRVEEAMARFPGVCECLTLLKSLSEEEDDPATVPYSNGESDQVDADDSTTVPYSVAGSGTVHTTDPHLAIPPELAKGSIRWGPA